LKIQDGGSRHVENYKNRDVAYPQRFDRSLPTKFGTLDAGGKWVS